MAYLGKLAPTVGNGLGGLPERQSSALSSDEQFLLLDKTTITINTPANTVEYPLPFVPDDPSQLTIKVIVSDARLLPNMDFMIPRPVTGEGAMYFVFGNISLIVVYNKDQNTISCTSTNAVVKGRMDVCLYDRHVVNSEFLAGTSGVETELPFVIEKIKNCYVGAIFQGVAPMPTYGLFLSDYCPSHEPDWWNTHITPVNGSQPRSLKITSPSSFITTLSNSVFYIVEFR